MTEIAIETKELTKLYGFIYGAKNVNLQVRHGEFFGLFGPNGSGKTTLIKLISGLLVPTKGQVFVYGIDVNRQPDRAKALIGLALSGTLLYGDLSVRENLDFYLNAFVGSVEKARISEALRLFGLKRRENDHARTLSTGLARRADLIRSYLHDPKLLLFDEPFAGLDIKTIDTLTEFLLKWKGQKTAVFTSHSIETLRTLCDRVAVMKNGEVIEVIPVNELTKEKVRSYFA
jgi:ABC-2 type transport system ATP-binding protein